MLADGQERAHTSTAAGCNQSCWTDVEGICPARQTSRSPGTVRGEGGNVDTVSDDTSRSLGLTAAPSSGA